MPQSFLGSVRKQKKRKINFGLLLLLAIPRQGYLNVLIALLSSTKKMPAGLVGACQIPYEWMMI